MRTISQTTKYSRERDPNCTISEWYLKTSLRNGKLSRSHNYKLGTFTKYSNAV